jgi:hypothetical protein
MPHIGNTRTKLLRQKAEAFGGLLAKADEWVAANLRHEEQDHAQRSVKEARRTLRHIQRSIGNKPAFAVFGASQVGKSYLVKNLLSVDGAPLTIDLGGREVDFLKEINPAGIGAESTGVVTRFSIAHDPVEDGLPVRVKLLDPKDLALILCDSHFSDLRGVAHLSDEAFAAHARQLLERYRGRPIVQQALVEEDVLDMRSYFVRHFDRHGDLAQRLERTGIWRALGEVVQHIPPGEWSHALSVLWSNERLLTDLYARLVEQLERLAFPAHLDARGDAVLRERGEILDVRTLRRMLEPHQQQIVRTSTGEELQLGSGVLSALAAEVTLRVPAALAESKPFLKNTDLLDLPGARSRLILEAAQLTREMVPDMYLRGKVAYLFNKYSGEHEINNLLFCQNDQQSNVSELPALLNDWIASNIGKSPDDRERNLQGLSTPPLFIVFTFVNNQLRFDITNDSKEDLGYKWETRFQRFFVDELVTDSYDWQLNWTRTSPQFRNFFLLRDLKYSGDSFAGYEASGRETGIQPEREQHLQRVGKAFVEHPFVKRHFREPQRAWESISSPNADGSALIIEHLAPVANDEARWRHHVAGLNEHRDRLLQQLGMHLRSEDLMTERENALQKGLDLQMELNRFFGQSPDMFSTLQQRLLVKPPDLYHVVHENLLPSRNSAHYDEHLLFVSQHPGLSLSNTREQNQEIIRRKRALPDHAAVEQFLQRHGLDLERALRGEAWRDHGLLMERILEAWRDRLSTAAMEDLFDLGLSRSAHSKLVDLVATAFDRSPLRTRMAELVKERTARIQLDHACEEYLATACAAMLNEFTLSLGLNDMNDEERQVLERNMAEIGAEPLSLQTYTTDPGMEELSALFDGTDQAATLTPMLTGVDRFLSGIRMALVRSCGVADHDVAANHALKEVVDGMRNCVFDEARLP